MINQNFINMKFTNLHWGFALLILAGAVFLGIVASEAYMTKKGSAIAETT